MPSTLGIVSSNYVELPPPTFTGTTVLLLSGEGPNGGNNNTFLDDSSAVSPKTITAHGSPTQGSFSPFPLNGAIYNPTVHGGSGYFNGSSNLSTPRSSSLNFGNGSFTIEGWIHTSTPDAYYQAIFSIGAPIQIYLSRNTVEAWFNDSDDLTSYIVQSLTGPANSVLPDTWTHFAVVRNGSTFTVYVNGVAGTPAAGVTGSVFYSAVNPAIANLDYGGGYFYTGYISNLRIVKGTALYTSNFTRPTAPLTTTSNGGGGGIAPPNPSQVSLLLNFTNEKVIDYAARKTIITVGNAQISTTQKKNGNSSIYFDGNGDLLKIPHSNDFVFGSKNFMIATWIYNVDTSGSRTIFSKRPSTTGAGGGYRGVVLSSSNGTYSANVTFTGNSWLFFNAGAARTNTWEHIAFIRQGTTFTFYVNGRPVATSSDSRAIVDSTTASVTIGADSDATTFYSNCYLDDFVIMTNP